MMVEKQILSYLRDRPSASQVGGNVIMPFSVSTTPSPKKSVRKIGEHQLLVVREHMQVSRNAILAQVSPTSQQAIYHFGTSGQTRLA